VAGQQGRSGRDVVAGGGGQGLAGERAVRTLDPGVVLHDGRAARLHADGRGAQGAQPPAVGADGDVEQLRGVRPEQQGEGGRPAGVERGDHHRARVGAGRGVAVRGG
jgi:hypothetical protein